MKALPAILNDVMILLTDPHVARARVTITRGDHEPLDERCSTFQLRLSLDDERDLLCEARSWLGGQWSSWHKNQGWLGGGGFDVRDVLATDWRIIA